MIYCEIKKCLPNNVYVLGAFDEEFEMTLEFYGTKTPKEGDFLVLHENLFDYKSPEFTQPYGFEISDKEIISEQELDEETAILKSDEKIYVLKRIYG